MRFFAYRALSIGRQASLLPASKPVPSLAQRVSLLPTIQTARASFQAQASSEPVPSEKPVNPNSKSKIHDRSRPMKRFFLPPPTKTEEELAASFPYIVRRTPYNHIPIYRKWMSGGNRVIIQIKKIDGDRRKLVEDLTAALELKKEDIRLNPTTQHIEIKGNHFEKALDWLLATGF